jgi:hypothetical protein
MVIVHKAAQNGDKAAMDKVHGAFGVTPDMKGIEDNIQALKVGTFKMEQAQDLNDGGLGFYDPNSGRVELGSGFHLDTTPEQRAGFILHEASHAVIGTKDVFNANGHPHGPGKAQSR